MYRTIPLRSTTTAPRPVLHAEIQVAVVRVDADVVDVLGRAEAFLSERQIDRQRQDDDVFVEPGGFAVEADVLQRADGCVH